MTRGAFTFADLFCGIGGMRIGLEGAGGTCVFSSEINKHAVETYRANFGDEPQGDISSINTRHIPPHDILAAGFPCQPFSIAGVSKRNHMGLPSGIESPQGDMFDEIVRVVRAKKPSALLLENVKHLQRFNNGQVYSDMVNSLEREGYTVREQVIDARIVVPQHRERLFIVGLRDGDTFQFPKIRKRDCRLGDILEDSPGDRYTLTRGVWNALKKHKIASQEAGKGFGYSIANLESVARTLSRRYYKDGSEILISRGRGQIPRRLTPRECARLMGFPENFKIAVSDSQAYRQFGNSVVPKIVEAVGVQIGEHLRLKPLIAVRTHYRRDRN